MRSCAQQFVDVGSVQLAIKAGRVRKPPQFDFIALPPGFE
jgi:hypothetical protein